MLTNSPVFKLASRKDFEGLENRTLAAYAKQSAGGHESREHEESEHIYRTSFQRDRDRIIHSRAFRRLKHKRQVFLTTESDHYRTRITHTLEVSQLARTFARALCLNEDLAEAIALGHDLGHTPFGHLGEVVLNDIMSGARRLPAQPAEIHLGGFKHNYQSVRIVDSLERKYSFRGLNLTAAVREGILKHTRLRRGAYDFPDFRYEGLAFEQDMSITLEGQVVALSDEIAQRTHDLEDGIGAGLVELSQVAGIPLVGQIVRQLKLDLGLTEKHELYQGLIVRALINLLVGDVIGETLRRLQDFFDRKARLQDFDEEIVSFSPKVDPLQKELNKFIYQEIIHFSRVKWSDDLGRKLLFRLFESYHLHPDLLPAALLEKELEVPEARFQQAPGETTVALQRNPAFYRAVCDYIAGMTDSYAIREAERLARLDKLKIDDLKIEFARGA